MDPLRVLARTVLRYRSESTQKPTYLEGGSHAKVTMETHTYAFKTPHDPEDEASCKKIRDEFSLLRKAQGSPNIITVVQPCEIQMEAVKPIFRDIGTNETTFKIKTQPHESIGQDDARILFFDICNAIQHLIEKQVKHNDIKPENIGAIRTEGRWQFKLFDFGEATEG